MRTGKLTIYRDQGQWRWRIQAANGRIIGASSEAYRKRQRACENVFTVTGYAVRLIGESRGDSIVREFRRA